MDEWITNSFYQQCGSFEVKYCIVCFSENKLNISADLERSMSKNHPSYQSHFHLGAFQCSSVVFGNGFLLTYILVSPYTFSESCTPYHICPPPPSWLPPLSHFTAWPTDAAQSASSTLTSLDPLNIYWIRYLRIASVVLPHIFTLILM